MKRYLLTGGAGFFGDILKRRLLDAGHGCVSIDLQADQTRHANLVTVQGDIRDRTAVAALFETHRFDGVYHCAAILAHAVKDREFLWSCNVDATRTLAADVTWGDQVFAAGTTVNSSYDFTDYRISAGYSFFRRRDKELGAGFGVHVAKIDASIATTGGIVEGSDVTAPLPVLNLYGTFALTNEWAVRMRLDWLSLNYDVYSGDLRNTAFDVLYRPFRNVGFGLGVRNLVLNVEIDDTKWRGNARTVFTGPTVFMSIGF